MASITLGPFLFSDMTTVFERLKEYYNNNNITPLDVLQKCSLGRIVAKAWYSSGNQFKDFLKLKTITEDTGVYKVLSYPDYYTPEIDRMIHTFYLPPPIKKRNQPKQRKRIPIKPFKLL